MRFKVIIVLTGISFTLTSLFMGYSLINKFQLETIENDTLLGKCENSISKKRDPQAFLEFAMALRLLKTYYETYKHGSHMHFEDIEHEKMITCFNTLEKQLFPWIVKKSWWPWASEPMYKDIDSIVATFPAGSRGIVISSCDSLFDYTVHMIIGLRQLSVNIPIMVTHVGNSDLSLKKQEYLHNMNVLTLDVSLYFDDSWLKMAGYAIKPFSILAAPFQEVMFLDADAVFITSPMKFFEDAEYKKTGHLFQKDRAIHHRWPKQKNWLEEHVPKPFSETLKETQIYRGFGDHQMDSSFLIIDKHKRIFSLLATCKLNANKERENFYYYFHGDKESFWIGAEMAGEPYSFLPHSPGVFGNFIEPTKLCGRQLLFDREGLPFYFNEAVVWDKSQPHDKREVMPMPTHYEHHGRWYEHEQQRCLFTHGIEFTSQELARFEQLYSSFQHYPV